jgi:hypothetical protein
MNCAVDAAAPKQRRIGCIDNRIHFKPGDVALPNFYFFEYFTVHATPFHIQPPPSSEKDKDISKSAQFASTD